MHPLHKSPLVWPIVTATLLLAHPGWGATGAGPAAGPRAPAADRAGAPAEPGPGAGGDEAETGIPELSLGAEALGETVDIRDRRLEPPPAAWQDSTVLARVGDEPVTAGDFYHALDRGKGIDRTAPPAELKRATLEKLVNQRLMVQEARRRGYNRVGPFVSHVTKVEDQVAAEELRRRIYVGKVDVTRGEILELYERYFYTFRVLSLSVDRRDRAADLRARILAGEDFGDLARSYSEEAQTKNKGGDMGELGAGQMIIHFEDAVFAIEPGQLTPVIKGRGEHYKLFKLVSRTRDRTPQRTIDEMAPDLARRVRTRKTGDALYAWQQSMLDKYAVVLHDSAFAVFAGRLRSRIAMREEANSVRSDSLPTSWIFTDWPPEELALDLVTYNGGRLTTGEFNRTSRQQKSCPTCVWHNSDVQLKQVVLGSAFDKIYMLELRSIVREHVPALDLQIERGKEGRLTAMVGATVAVTADSVTADHARAFYEAHQNEYVTGDRMRVRRIVVGTEAEAASVMERLAGGADFAALANEVSLDETTNWRGGETDFFGPDSMDGMADVALKHEPGELIPPFRSRRGWEIVQVIEKTASMPRPFPEVQNDVKSRVAAVETERRIDALIAALRAATSVTIDEQAMARLTVPAANPEP